MTSAASDPSAFAKSARWPRRNDNGHHYQADKRHDSGTFRLSGGWIRANLSSLRSDRSPVLEQLSLTPRVGGYPRVPSTSTSGHPLDLRGQSGMAELKGWERPSRNGFMDNRWLIQICVVASALAVVVAVAALPWQSVIAFPEWVRTAGGQLIHDPFRTSRTHSLPDASARAPYRPLDPFGARCCFESRSRSRPLAVTGSVLGVGIVMLTLLVQPTLATGASIGSSHIQPGNTVTFVTGLIIALAGASSILLRTRPSNRPTQAVS